MKVRPREAADQAAAEAFLARHDSFRAARMGELVHPLDHPAFVAEAADGQLALAMTTARRLERLDLRMARSSRCSG